MDDLALAYELFQAMKQISSSFLMPYCVPV